MQLINNRLAIPAGWLIGEGVISKDNYDQLKFRRDIQVFNRGCRNSPAMVDYESLPDRFKKAVKELLGGNPYNMIGGNMLTERMEHSVEASAYFDEYEVTPGVGLKEKYKRTYYANAVVLNALHTLMIDIRGMRNKHTTFSWEKLHELLAGVDSTIFPHDLPKNPRRLEDKYKAYKKGGYKVLISKKFANKNSIKIDDQQKEHTLAYLIGLPVKLDNVEVAEEYNKLAAQCEWKAITPRAVESWRKKLKQTIGLARNGKTHYNNNNEMQVKRHAPELPLAFWTLDGWNAELRYQKTANGKTTYHHRVTIVVVLDTFLKYPIGYAIGANESSELIKEALRDAAKHTESLFGQMYRVAQIQSDHFAMSAMESTYTLMSKTYTPARVKNAKAKVIEPWFKYFNKKYCKKNVNWSGYGVTSKKENQPNMEFLQKFNKDIPDFDGVCRQLSEAIEHNRSMLRDKYVELFDTMPDERKLPLPYDKYLLHFGSTTGNRNLLQPSGLAITIGGIKHTYDSFDHAFRNHSSARWEIRFDPDNLERVLAVNEEGNLHFVLEEKYEQPMALIDRRPGDYEQLERVRNFNAEQVANATRYIEQMATSVIGTMASLPNRSDEEMLSKFLITDSKGQHKNILAQAAGKYTEYLEVDDEAETFNQY